MTDAATRIQANRLPTNEIISLWESPDRVYTILRSDKFEPLFTGTDFIAADSTYRNLLVAGISESNSCEV